MITSVNAAEEVERGALSLDWYGRKILAYLDAYGAGYDFCRFYVCQEGEVTGYLMHLNATLVICAGAALPADELRCFIAMHAPFRVEASAPVMEAILDTEGYQPLHRTVFALTPAPLPDWFSAKDVEQSPRLDDVYAILQEGFPNLLQYDLWLTDTSHCVRNGTTRVFTYKDSTTATVIYDVDDQVLVGQVATKVAARGSGYARAFLYWLADMLRAQGKQAVLFALDIRVSFYREIGFTPVAQEHVLERLDGHPEPAGKGRLS